MSRPTGNRDTRRAILDIGERLMMTRGYNGFSYSDIAEELGVKPAAIHYHFRTKSALGVAVLQRYGRRFDRWCADQRGCSPGQKLLGYFEVGRGVVAARRVCALGMVNTQFSAMPVEVQEVAKDVQQRIVGFYAEALREGQELGEVGYIGAAEDKAVEIACTLVGGQQMARAFGPAAFDKVLHQVTRSLGLPSLASPG
jgi:TetR/AcrR family transcriptional regulator, transcriptional repressor for nem operon